jgi:hypothetical protein
MRRQDIFAKAMVFDDGLYLSTNIFFAESLMCDAEAHRHDLDGNNTHLLVGPALFDTGSGIELPKEVDVGIQPDTYPVDEHDREFGTRGVWTMPIGKMLDGRSLATKERNRSQREQRPETGERSAVEVEAVILESAKGQDVDDADTLEDISL